VQQQQRKQQQQLQQQPQQETVQENKQQQAAQHVQDLSSAITRKAEEILQMQSSLPHNTAFNPSNIPANPSALSLSPNSIPITTSVPVCTTVGVSVSSAGDSAPTAAPHISEGDIQSAILDNLFGHRTSVSGSANSSRLFQTSSDTVNQLLRGLNTKTQSESIQKLSRDTASVLPTFARVLESSIGSQPLSAPGAVCSDGDGAGGPVRDVEEGEGGGDDRLGEGELSLASVTGEAVPGAVDHSNLSLSEVLAEEGSEDSMFQQMVKNGDLLEGLEFPVDTLSQLPATPPRHRAGTSGILSPPSTVSEWLCLYVYTTPFSTCW
jgi:hypothetical protein